MKLRYLSLIMMVPLLLIPVYAQELQNNTQYSWSSSKAFLIFETNESGFEMIDGGIYDEGKWKIFDTKSRSFTLSENYNLLIFAGSFEKSEKQYFLTMTIKENIGDLSIWMQGENNEIIKYRSFGQIKNIYN